MSKIAFYTLGCKSNQYETDIMKKKCLTSGHEIVPFEEKADHYIINTCTVTGNADKKSRNIIRAAKKRNKKSIVIVTGCYVETTNFGIKEADIILNNINKFNVAKYIRDQRPETRDQKTFRSPVSDIKSPRIRANLMIENGCENHCTYCIVPFVRGKIKCKPFDQVIAEAKSMVNGGVKEIILTGINIGEYKTNLSSRASHLTSLISELSKIDGLLRIRISSIEPQYVNDALINVIKNNPKVCKHLHIPLQSGDDKTLKAMNRKYSSKEFLSMVKKIKSRIKDVAITTDIIIGFPGEDEKAFRNTLKLAAMVQFSRIHIFSYSDRPGTAASKLPNKVPPKVIAARRKELDLLRADLMAKFHRSFRKRAMDVLIEQKDIKTGMYEGLTSNYIRVFLKNFPSNIMNKPSPKAGDDTGDEYIGLIIPVQFKEFQGGNVFALPVLL